MASRKFKYCWGIELDWLVELYMAHTEPSEMVTWNKNKFFRPKSMLTIITLAQSEVNSVTTVTNAESTQTFMVILIFNQDM